MPVLESLINEFAAPKACNFVKKILQYRFFPVKFAKVLRKTFFKEQLWWLLLVLDILMLQLPICFVLE